MNANQQAVYRYILHYKGNHDGNSPTVREILAATQYSSTSAVLAALQALEREGLIELQSETQTRSIQVVGAQWIPPAWVEWNEDYAGITFEVDHDH